MEDKLHSRLAPALMAAAVLLPVMLLVAYVVGYFWLGDRADAYTHPPTGFSAASITIDRVYAHNWQAVIYQPAAHIESKIRGVQVFVTSEDQWNWNVVDFN
jgi:hypothetical protein